MGLSCPKEKSDSGCEGTQYFDHFYEMLLELTKLCDTAFGNMQHVNIFQSSHFQKVALFRRLS